MTQDRLLQLGILLTLIGAVVIFISLASAAGKGNAKFSVVGFFGFIPFGFGNDKKLVMIMLILAIAVVAAMMLFLRSAKP